MRRVKKTSTKMSAPGMRQIVTNYERFDFTPGKVDGKRVAFCNHCHTKLCNTGVNRLKKHRMTCMRVPYFPELQSDVKIKTEKSDEDVLDDLQETIDNLSNSFEEKQKNLEEQLQNTADYSNKAKRPLEEDECNDELFMKSMLALMRDLPLNMKDNFQSIMYQEVYKLRAQARKKRRL